MDLIKTEELRTWDPSRLRETETDIRRQLSSMRMDLYQSAQTQVGKTRKLKINLARVLTVANEQRKQASKVASKGKV